MTKENSEQLEKDIILSEYRSLLRALKNKVNPEEKKNIRKAFKK